MTDIQSVYRTRIAELVRSACTDEEFYRGLEDIADEMSDGLLGEGVPAKFLRSIRGVRDENARIAALNECLKEIVRELSEGHCQCRVAVHNYRDTREVEFWVGDGYASERLYSFQSETSCSMFPGKLWPTRGCRGKTRSISDFEALVKAVAEHGRWLPVNAEIERALENGRRPKGASLICRFFGFLADIFGNDDTSLEELEG